jgi:hypothetical protein
MNVLNLYEFVISRKNPVYGPGYFGREDDLSSACPICRAGVRRVSDPVIDYKETKGKPILWAGSEFIVIRNEIKDILEASGLRGFSLNPVADFKGRVFPFSYYELIATQELPPMAVTSICNREQVCRRCQRGGYTTLLGPLPRQLHYEREALTKIEPSDFYRTWEFWGSPDWIFRRVYPKQSLIVGSRVKELLESNKIRMIEFPAVIVA